MAQSQKTGLEGRELVGGSLGYAASSVSLKELN